MAHKIPDERLRDVCEGYALLTAQELAALIPEIASEGHIHRMIAPAIIARRLRAMEETTNHTSRVIPLRAKRSKTRI